MVSLSSILQNGLLQTLDRPARREAVEQDGAGPMGRIDTVREAEDLGYGESGDVPHTAESAVWHAVPARRAEDARTCSGEAAQYR